MFSKATISIEIPPFLTWFIVGSDKETIWSPRRIATYSSIASFHYKLRAAEALAGYEGMVIAQAVLEAAILPHETSHIYSERRH